MTHLDFLEFGRKGGGRGVKEHVTRWQSKK